MARKLKMNTPGSQALHDAFVGDVLGSIKDKVAEFNKSGFRNGKIEVATGVEFLEQMSTGWLYEFTIEFKGPVILFELQELQSCLEQFCVWNRPGKVVGGRKFIIGDGDDSLAVYYRDGKFRIWLRHFMGE